MVKNNENFKSYLDLINEIAENDSLSQQEKVQKIISAYDKEVKRILYTDQGLIPPD
jgi:hypothetical protein